MSPAQGLNRLRLVGDAEEVRAALETFNAEARRWPDRAHSLLRNTSYWVYDPNTGAFGPSKFMGFVGMNFRDYERARAGRLTGARFDGGVTQNAIRIALNRDYMPNAQLARRLEVWGEALLEPGIFEGVDTSKWRFVKLPVVERAGVTGMDALVDEAGDLAEEAESELVGDTSAPGEPTDSASKGPGRQQDPRVRKAVELWAMKAAEAYFTREGFSVKDVSSKNPYDLLCRRGDETLYVEVKGTTGGGGAVAVTYGEVRFNVEHPGQMALYVLHGVEVISEGATVEANGGTARILWPWSVQEGVLTPIAYSFALPEVPPARR